MDIEATMQNMKDALISYDADEMANMAYAVEDWLTMQGRPLEAGFWHNIAVAYES